MKPDAIAARKEFVRALRDCNARPVGEEPMLFAGECPDCGGTLTAIAVDQAVCIDCDRRYEASWEPMDSPDRKIAFAVYDGLEIPDVLHGPDGRVVGRIVERRQVDEDEEIAGHVVPKGTMLVTAEVGGEAWEEISDLLGGPPGSISFSGAHLDPKREDAKCPS